ncbi:D-alanyl-D-alanine carboxypeptidase family protein [sulfur-oxidizing endosymbiont of Gigantopelta aegis]|uniref:D-alanyl-D-alanine carboxypeptidase family protein n=1 Tax=sulfur-oxidizing endosymbiont of Gigantopelta aegis TaxID=2794934 RepID=UPI0018DB8C00|nr:D-alanyl-D-alanine carboxypeptidase family protein [sulfur-oxidizing endosymbiont of Gigantopelta aegis]
MKRTLSYFFIAIFALIFTLNAQAAPKIIPKAPTIAAKSYILIDYNSSKVIAQKNADMPVAPASITKVMTAYVIFAELEEGNIQLSDLVTVSKKAWKTPGSRMFIKVNSKVSVEDLLQGMIIQSGNDASVALAEHIAGSEDTFAALMNQHAQELGMSNTHFLNSTGLPNKNHKTSAKDLAILANSLIKRFPQYYKWYSTKEFTYNNIKQSNRNKLLWRDSSVDGMKTGFTDDAGYCLLSSAKRNNMRLISVVLGTNSANARAQESQKLLNFGFRFYESHIVYPAQKTLKSVRVFKGHTKQLPVGVVKDLAVTIPRGQYKNLKPSININMPLVAPIAKGQKLGKVELRLDGKILSISPLVALKAINEGSLWQQAKDSALMMLE